MNELAEALQNRDRVLSLGLDYLARNRELYIEETPGESTESTETLLHIAEGNIERSVNLIFDCAESPIEQIFLSSILLCSVLEGESISTVFMFPMPDVVKNMKDWREGMASLRRATAAGMNTGDLLKRLDAAKNVGELDDFGWHQNFSLLLNYHILDNAKSLHVSPQPSFPGLINKGGIRGDVLFWCPAKPRLKVVVECDSYTYHDNHKSFDYDRQRSRALQEKGFEVLQYSGGEIYRDPAKVGIELYRRLSARLPKTKSNATT